MKRNPNPLAQMGSMSFVLALAIWGLLAAPVPACTIFVLTNTNRVLFCNNEDWSDPKTMIWFVPAGPDHYGCVCRL